VVSRSGTDFGSGGIPACLFRQALFIVLRSNPRKSLVTTQMGMTHRKAGRDACAPVHELIAVESLILEVLQGDEECEATVL